MHKVQQPPPQSSLVTLYNDLIDTALVLQAMRDSDPKKAMTLSEFKKRKRHA